MIFISCALLVEAKPLIEHFRLKKIVKKLPFPLFQGDGISLIISGVGKHQLSSALNFAYGYLQAPENSAWINVGTSAHKNAAIGSTYRITKLKTIDQSETLYPYILPELKIPSKALTTVDELISSPKEDSLYDMEGYHFFKIVSRLTYHECIQCLKVVSDHGMNEKVFKDRAKIRLVMQKTLTDLEEMIKILRKIQSSLPSIFPPLFETCLNSWHFSETESSKLKHLLHGYHAKGLDLSSALDFSTGQELINYLEEALYVI